MPRRVPFLAFEATLACAITVLSPRSRNSCWQKARAKKPRSSVLRSRSMMKAPLSLVSVKIIARLPSGRRQRQSCVALCGRGLSVSQVFRENAVGDQLLDMADALVARALELLE